MIRALQRFSTAWYAMGVPDILFKRPVKKAAFPVKEKVRSPRCAPWLTSVLLIFWFVSYLVGCFIMITGDFRLKICSCQLIIVSGTIWYQSKETERRIVAHFSSVFAS